MLNVNGTMMQYFHWYISPDDNLWKKVEREAPALAAAGITALWLPPAYKGAAGIQDVGYGPYDLYDLGEFDQKGSVATKYGTSRQYLAAIGAAHDAGIQVYADMVFNHRGGADRTEWVKAVRVHPQDRRFSMGEDEWIEAFTEFDFPGRQGRYSDFQWHYHHFDGVDWAENLGESTIFKFLGADKDWERLVDDENGNYDYLMYSDLDMNNADVRTELARWGAWYLETTGVDGFRLDAVKHIQFSFFRSWLDHMRKIAGRPLFAVGEYWNPYDVEDLHNYIRHTHGKMSLFDAPLHRNFHDASRAGGHYDMRRILDNTLMQQQPHLAVTLVENHDTQPLQSLESPVAGWFKPLAYAIILLREEAIPVSSIRTTTAPPTRTEAGTATITRSAWKRWPTCRRCSHFAGSGPTAPSGTIGITRISSAGPGRGMMIITNPAWPCCSATAPADPDGWRWAAATAAPGSGITWATGLKP
jgi:alpha-amylase